LLFAMLCVHHFQVKYHFGGLRLIV